MIIPKNLEELASYVESDPKGGFLFTADWCPDCQFIYPVMPEIEAPPSRYVPLCVLIVMIIWLWHNLEYFGIPSFVVTKKGQELGRLVSKAT